jgi:thioredoxin 1
MSTQTQAGPPLPGGQDAIRTVTDRTFQRLILEGDGPIAVEFMSYGCAHCRTLEPILQEVAATLRSSEALFRVNIAVEQGLAESYQITGTPTLIMFLNGQQVGRVDGPHPTLSSVLTAVTRPFEA